MSDRVELERAPDGARGLPRRGQWRIVAGAIWVSCPDCAAVGMLDHDVADDGAVSPSLVCPREGCGFHAWARLGGWRP